MNNTIDFRIIKSTETTHYIEMKNFDCSDDVIWHKLLEKIDINNMSDVLNALIEKDMKQLEALGRYIYSYIDIKSMEKETHKKIKQRDKITENIVSNKNKLKALQAGRHDRKMFIKNLFETGVIQELVEIDHEEGVPHV